MIKLSLLIIIMGVSGCNASEKMHTYSIAEGKAFHWAWYKCKFGVLHSDNSDLVAMIDINGSPIACTKKVLTYAEYEKIKG